MPSATNYGGESRREKRKKKNKNRYIELYKREKVIPTGERGSPGSNEVEKVCLTANSRKKSIFPHNGIQLINDTILNILIRKIRIHGKCS